MSFISFLARRLHLTPQYDPSLILRDIAYFSGTDAHVNHKLDIFLPASSEKLLASSDEESTRKKVPIVVHVPAGGWVHGSRTSEWLAGPTVGRTCAKEGFVGVVLSHRLVCISLAFFLTWVSVFGVIIFIISLTVRSWQLATGYIALMTVAYAYNFLYKVRKPINIEHMIDDICLALVYIRDHIHEHYPQADPDQIFLSGHSAGAHLITSVVLDKSHLERHKISRCTIRGVIAMSGIYSLSSPTHASKHNFRTLIFRLFYASNLLYPEGKTTLEYSPIEHVKEDEQVPPFLVMSARFDMGLEAGARHFVDKFRKSNLSVEYYVIGGMTTHGTIASQFSKNSARRHFFTFIRQHMK